MQKLLEKKFKLTRASFSKTSKHLNEQLPPKMIGGTEEEEVSTKDIENISANMIDKKEVQPPTSSSTQNQDGRSTKDTTSLAEKGA